MPGHSPKKKGINVLLPERSLQDLLYNKKSCRSPKGGKRRSTPDSTPGGSTKRSSRRDLTTIGTDNSSSSGALNYLILSPDKGNRQNSRDGKSLVSSGRARGKIKSDRSTTAAGKQTSLPVTPGRDSQRPNKKSSSSNISAELEFIKRNFGYLDSEELLLARPNRGPEQGSKADDEACFQGILAWAKDTSWKSSRPEDDYFFNPLSACWPTRNHTKQYTILERNKILRHALEPKRFPVRLESLPSMSTAMIVEEADARSNSSSGGCGDRIYDSSTVSLQHKLPRKKQERNGMDAQEEGEESGTPPLHLTTPSADNKPSSSKHPPPVPLFSEPEAKKMKRDDSDDAVASPTTKLPRQKGVGKSNDVKNSVGPVKFNASPSKKFQRPSPSHANKQAASNNPRVVVIGGTTGAASSAPRAPPPQKKKYVFGAGTSNSPFHAMEQEGSTAKKKKKNRDHGTLLNSPSVVKQRLTSAGDNKNNSARVKIEKQETLTAFMKVSKVGKPSPSPGSIDPSILASKNVQKRIAMMMMASPARKAAAAKPSIPTSSQKKEGLFSIFKKPSSLRQRRATTTTQVVSGSRPDSFLSPPLQRTSRRGKKKPSSSSSSSSPRLGDLTAYPTEISPAAKQQQAMSLLGAEGKADGEVYLASNNDTRTPHPSPPSSHSSFNFAVPGSSSSCTRSSKRVAAAARAAALSGAETLLSISPRASVATDRMVVATTLNDEDNNQDDDGASAPFQSPHKKSKTLRKRRSRVGGEDIGDAVGARNLLSSSPLFISKKSMSKTLRGKRKRRRVVL
eukprot:jgi/Bigna1/126398/aug1.2_g1106